MARTQRPPNPTTFPDQLPSLLLRAGLAFVFSYAAMTVLIHPATLAKYMPSVVAGSAVTLMPFFAAYEVLLAIWLLSGRKTYGAALLAAVTISTITLVNLDAFDLLFRNVAIACAALSLAAQAHQRAPAPARGLTTHVHRPRVRQPQPRGRPQPATHHP